jgi:hypothetical protein
VRIGDESKGADVDVDSDAPTGCGATVHDPVAPGMRITYLTLIRRSGEVLIGYKS